jgi:Flp pilus assembly pilin Flp
MNTMKGLMDGPLGVYVRTILEVRIGELRRRVSERDVGASAIELAIITAIIGAVAVALAIIIKTVVTNKGNTIKGL